MSRSTWTKKVQLGAQQNTGPSKPLPIPDQGKNCPKRTYCKQKSQNRTTSPTGPKLQQKNPNKGGGAREEKDGILKVSLFIGTGTNNNYKIHVINQTPKKHICLWHSWCQIQLLRKQTLYETQTLFPLQSVCIKTGSQVLQLQSQPTPSLLQHHAEQLGWGVCLLRSNATTLEGYFAVKCQCLSYRSLHMQMIGRSSTDSFFFFLAFSVAASPPCVSFLFSTDNRMLMAAYRRR